MCLRTVHLLFFALQMVPGDGAAARSDAGSRGFKEKQSKEMYPLRQIVYSIRAQCKVLPGLCPKGGTPEKSGIQPEKETVPWTFLSSANRINTGFAELKMRGAGKCSRNPENGL